MAEGSGTAVTGPGGTRARRRPGGLLWQRNFRLLWAGETVSGTGNAMAVVGVPLLAVSVLHASTFAVAAITAAAYLPWLVIGLPAGAWVDRLSCRPLMIACDVISALLYASLPAAAWAGVLSTWQVVAVALLAGAVSVFFATAYRVCLPSLVSAGDLIEGNAKLQGSASAAAIGGRSAAGLAAQAVGAATALLFNAASFLVSAACLLAIRAGTPARPPARTGATLRAEVREGAAFILHDPYLRPMTLYGTVANLAYSGSTALVVVFLVRVVGLSPAATGLLVAVSGFGGIAGAMAARRLAQRAGSARVLQLSIVTAAFGLLIPLTRAGPGTALYGVGATVVAFGITTGGIMVGSFRQQYCPPSMLGRITATMSFLVFGGIPLGAVIAGALGTAIGVRGSLWVMLALNGLSGTLLLTRAVRADRNLPDRPPERRDG
jgi:predicted MFS family arabinose efflux permease